MEEFIVYFWLSILKCDGFPISNVLSLMVCNILVSNVRARDKTCIYKFGWTFSTCWKQEVYHQISKSWYFLGGRLLSLKVGQCSLWSLKFGSSWTISTRIITSGFVLEGKSLQDASSCKVSMWRMVLLSVKAFCFKCWSCIKDVCIVVICKHKSVALCLLTQIQFCDIMNSGQFV